MTDQFTRAKMLLGGRVSAHLVNLGRAGFLSVFYVIRPHWFSPITEKKNTKLKCHLRQGVWKGVLLSEVGVRGRAPRNFLNRTPKRPHFDILWSSCISFHTINSRSASRCCIVVCEVACPQASRAACLQVLFQWWQTRKGENSWNPDVHRVYRGRQPVSPLPSAPGFSSRLPHPHKVKKFPSSWCHEESCLGETSLYTQAVQSELWASRMWHSSVLFPPKQSAPLNKACRFALQRPAWQRCRNCTVQRRLHFQRVSGRWRAPSELLKLGSSSSSVEKWAGWRWQLFRDRFGKAKLRSTDPFACWTGPDCEAELLRFRQTLASVFLARNLAPLNPAAAFVGCVVSHWLFPFRGNVHQGIGDESKIQLGQQRGVRSNRRTNVVYAHCALSDLLQRPFSQLRTWPRKKPRERQCRAKDLARTVNLQSNSYGETRDGVLVNFISSSQAVVALAFPYFSWGLPVCLGSRRHRFFCSVCLSGRDRCFFCFFFLSEKDPKLVPSVQRYIHHSTLRKKIAAFPKIVVLIIGSAEALPILCVRYFRWERERDTERERERERERKTEVTSPLSR